MSDAAAPRQVLPPFSEAPRRQAPAGKTFFYTLDGIRGVAALLIVLRHTEALFRPLELRESYLAVDVFFVLSGVVISQAYGARLRSTMSFRRFAWTRAVRIMPLYLLGTFISATAVAFGLMSVGPWRYAVLYGLLAVFMVPNPGIGTVNVYPLNNPAWSLPLELVVNVIYARFIRKMGSGVIVAVMTVSMLGMAFTLYKAQSHSLNIGFWARSFPFGLFRVGYSFFAGVLIFAFYDRRSKPAAGPWQTSASWAVIAATGFLFACHPTKTVQPYFDFAAVVFLFPALVYLALLVHPAGYSARVCRFLGAISYAVYTLHAPLSGLAEGVCEVLLHRSPGQYSPAAGFAFLIVLIPICVAADRLYDYPVRRFLLRLNGPAVQTQVD